MFSRAAFGPWILVFAALFSLGCAETARLRGGIATSRRNLEQIERNGAYVCAPRELAIAKAHLDFAELEIDQGMGSRAQHHFRIAQENLEAADRKSPPDKCAGPAVVIMDLPDDCVDDDGDRVCLERDECPDLPEDVDGYEDGDGCPEDQDSDNDGIADSVDQCPLDPEDMDGYLDSDGCPEPDNDLDGVMDLKDKCINDPEDPDGFQDDDGCPDPDNDIDEILDVDDECPNVKGVPEEKGCPKKYVGVQITETHIRIDQKIYFRTGKSKIMKKSYPILATVAEVLKDNPEITLSIEGHTDSQGSDKYNKRLSGRRAQAVMRHLTSKGKIKGKRLKYVGWGEDKPIDSNLTDEGRAANRRVEFVRTDVPPPQE